MMPKDQIDHIACFGLIVFGILYGWPFILMILNYIVTEVMQ